MHYATCQATLIEDLSKRQNKTFYLSARDDRSLDSDVRWNENKTLLNKMINICMNDLNFRERRDG